MLSCNRVLAIVTGNVADTKFTHSVDSLNSRFFAQSMRNRGLRTNEQMVNQRSLSDSRSANYTQGIIPLSQCYDALHGFHQFATPSNSVSFESKPTTRSSSRRTSSMRSSVSQTLEPLEKAKCAESAAD